MIPNNVQFNRKSVEYPTPAWLFRTLEIIEGPFILDVAASSWNTKCKFFIDSSIDGLHQRWHPHRCWCNPPYSHVGRWVKKAWDESRLGAKVVCLLPSYTDKAWWHEYILDKPVKIYAIKGRLRFENAQQAAPFASVAVVFDPRIKKQKWISLANTFGDIEVKLNITEPERYRLT